MAEDVVEYVAEQSNKTADAVAQLGRKGLSFSTLPSFNKDALIIGNHRIKEQQQNIAGNTLIYGNVDFGTWGSYYWGAGAQTSFILGHSVAGVLGTGLLGSNTSEFALLGAYNDDDSFPEGFWNDRFIDTGSSTGSWDTGSEHYYLDGQENLVTTYIAKEDKVYKSVLLTLNSINVTTGCDANSDLNIYAVINGSDYTLTFDTRTYFANTSNDGLKLKFENPGLDGGAEFPFTFPMTFGGGGETNDIIINEFTAKYYI